MRFRFGSFNLQDFNCEKEEKFEYILNIINESKLDIVSLQEINIRNDNEKYVIESMIKRFLGQNWNIKMDLISDGSDKEGSAFLYNNKFEYDEEDVKELNKYISFDLKRKPYFASFCPKMNRSMMFRLIGVHVFYGGSGDRKTRENEVNILLTKVYPFTSDNRKTSRNRAVYTLLMGDYNSSLCIKEGNRDIYLYKQVERHKHNDELPAFVPNVLEDDEGRRITTEQEKYTTFRDLQNEKYNDIEFDIENADESEFLKYDYDHFSYENNRFEDVSIRVERIDAPEICFPDLERRFDQYKDYKTSISDHMPIMIELDFSGDLQIGGEYLWQEKNSQ